MWVCAYLHLHLGGGLSIAITFRGVIVLRIKSLCGSCDQTLVLLSDFCCMNMG